MNYKIKYVSSVDGIFTAGNNVTWIINTFWKAIYTALIKHSYWLPLLIWGCWSIFSFKLHNSDINFENQ
jgi:hypothetical protein